MQGVRSSSLLDSTGLTKSLTGYLLVGFFIALEPWHHRLSRQLTLSITPARKLKQAIEASGHFREDV